MKQILHPQRFPSTLRRKASLNLRRSHWLIFISLLLFPMSWSQGPLFATGGEDTSRMEQKISLIIQDYSERLGITQHVVVMIAPANSLLASVQYISGGSNEYQISFASGFLRTLNDRELNAAVAHELGHIWIFTHFPYLQTETLANQQALKLVSRNDLERVYRKVWKWNGEKGSVEKVLGSTDDIDTRRDAQ